MFVRNSFVTNSSSTSFICYGIRLSEDDVRGLIPNEWEKEFYEVEEALDKITSEQLKGSSVELFWNSEMYTFILYIAETYLYLSERGVVEFPMDKIVGMTRDPMLIPEGMNAILLDALKKLQIGTWEQPKWWIALSIER